MDVSLDSICHFFSPHKSILYCYYTACYVLFYFDFYKFQLDEVQKPNNP
jgi:hypothetical protein